MIKAKRNKILDVKQRKGSIKRFSGLKENMKKKKKKIDR